MDGFGDGVMGKHAHSAWVALLSFSIVGFAAEAKPKLQTKLPSEVKRVRGAKAKAKPQSLSRSIQKKQSSLPPVADLIPKMEDKGLSPFDDKYVSRTVHFAASAAPVPEEYDCDSLIEEKQKRQAERDALAKCESMGEKHCRLHLLEIVKKGELRCQDIPGRDCRVRKFYRGCVAQAIVVGGEEPEAQASVF
jgi:hypothetical protein